jgi:hypothetical protein
MKPFNQAPTWRRSALAAACALLLAAPAFAATPDPAPNALAGAVDAAIHHVADFLQSLLGNPSGRDEPAQPRDDGPRNVSGTAGPGWDPDGTRHAGKPPGNHH